MPSLACNGNCSCDPKAFTPVCGSDGRNYFSPCYAGCQIESRIANKTVTYLLLLLSTFTLAPVRRRKRRRCTRVQVAGETEKFSVLLINYLRKDLNIRMLDLWAVAENFCRGEEQISSFFPHPPTSPFSIQFLQFSHLKSNFV